ncbi:sensor histidine kinase [Rubrivirga sp. IMCC43871]|uniref:sensor histidine kinase n=1 Tax=Rubrivirga sp. IMCC43871 TaxID=3391575 RepID=UPI00398FBE06
MRSPFPRRQVVLVGGLAALLALLAVLQWRWIGRWGAVEEARLQSLLAVGGAEVDRALTGRMLGIRDAFDRAPPGDAPADTLAARLAAWRATALDPGLVGAVYWVRPGPDPALSVLADGGLRPVAWPEALAPWRDALAAFPARLVPAPGTAVATLRLDDGALPAAPPAVLVPVLPPGAADLRFVLVALDPEVFAERLVPDLLANALPGAELFDVRLVSARDPSLALFDSAPEVGLFETPDLDLGVGPGEVQELAVALPPGGVEESETTETTREASVTTESDGPAQRWRLVARHRSGSVAEAAAGLRRRQLAVAFGVLAVLAAAVALMVGSARRQRALAAQQLAFVAGVSHELRTPIAVLQSAGDNLADGVVGADGVAAYGALVRDESRRLAEMVETVLTYAGADGGAPRREHVAVADVVADALARARPVLDDAGATVALDLDPGLALSADPDALATALRNLLANAARHGGASIRLAARSARLDGAPAVAVSVADDGPGFAGGEAVFEPFVRGRRAVEAQTPGSGLGLALVRRVAEAHGGTAEAVSASGAVVTLTLPVS